MACSRTVLTMVLFLLMAAFWIVLLAGTGAAHAACVQSNKPQTTQAQNQQVKFPQPQKGKNNAADKNKNIEDDGLPDLPQIIAAGRKLKSHGRELMGRAEDVCNNQMSLPWWVVWFEAITIVMGILVATSGFLSRFNSTAVAFYVMSTTIMMFNAATANDQIFNYKDNQDNNDKKYVAGIRCALAGMICLMILNFIYIICSTDVQGKLTPMIGGHSAPPTPTTTELPTHKAASALVTPTKATPVPVTPITPPYPTISSYPLAPQPHLTPSPSPPTTTQPIGTSYPYAVASQPHLEEPTAPLPRQSADATVQVSASPFAAKQAQA